MPKKSNELLLLNFLLESKNPGEVPVDQFLARALRTLRTHLGTDVALIEELVHDARVIRYADAADESTLQRASGSHGPLCAPIRLDDGRLYGSLSCAARDNESVYTARDVALVHVFAEMAAEHIDAELKALAHRRELVSRIQALMQGGSITCRYQPIVNVANAQIVGFEAFARFSTLPQRSPHAWFSDAARVGLELELENAVLAEALESFAHLPAPVYIAFNVSPNIIINGGVDRMFARVPLDRVVLEVNEHVSARQYEEIACVLRPLRDRGLRVSVDDAGRGVEGFRHVLNLKPDVIKLHGDLVRGIDRDGAQRALAGALLALAVEEGCDLVAQGVETTAELATLKKLGVRKMQGYLLARPASRESAVAMCSRRGAPRAAQPQHAGETAAIAF